MRNLLILMVLYALITKIISERQQDRKFKLCHGFHVFHTDKYAAQTDVQHLKKTEGLSLYV